jgi:bifunctional oligoribonuclease and PAP phosphatase NrnA
MSEKEFKKNVQDQIINMIRHSQRILLLASSPPDGDCIGSSLGMYLVLQKLKKDVTVVCCDPVPEILTFLPHVEDMHKHLSANTDFVITLDNENADVDKIKYDIDHHKINLVITPKNGTFSPEDVSYSYGEHKYDLIITVDTADFTQLGKNYTENQHIFTEVPIINIDHHASNSHFGRINYVNVMASSTTEMLTPLIDKLEEETGELLWDESIATLMLAGIITDTGSFQNANTTPLSFKVSADLVDKGADQQEIIKHVYKTRKLSTLHLWGKILSDITYDEKSRIVWSMISQDDFEETGTKPEDTEGIIDELLSNAPGAEVIVLLKEKAPGVLKASLRSTSDFVDVSAMAQLFGGGGHVRAAGFTKKLNKEFKLACMEMIDVFQSHQMKRLGTSLDEEESYGETIDFTKKSEKEGKIFGEILISEESKEDKESTENLTNSSATQVVDITSEEDSPKEKVSLTNIEDIISKEL